jgi:plasmid stabilization system protein ParE
MVKIKVFWTPEAKQTLSETIDFYAKTLSKKVADKRKRNIVLRTRDLSEFPLLGPIEESEALEGLSSRYLVEGHCKIIYKVVEDKVSILKVFDTHQRPDRMRF